MRRAGQYNTRLTWLLHVATKDLVTGQVKDSFTDNGYLWASVSDKSAAILPANGMGVAQSTTEIQIVGYPTIGFKDQLREKGTSTYYTIDGIIRSDDGLILSCTRKQIREGS